MDIEALLTGDKDARHYRQLEAEFGARLVHDAKVDVLIGVMIATRVFTKSEFLDMLDQQLRVSDRERQRQAGL